MSKSTDLVIKGRIEGDSSAHSTFRGKGSLKSDGHFLHWEVNGWKGRTNKAPWGNVRSFVRADARLTIEWISRSSNWDDQTRFVFDTTLEEAQQMESVARSILPDEKWRVPWVDEDGLKWDAAWFGGWGPA